MKKIGIIGTGNIGTAFTHALAISHAQRHKIAIVSTGNPQDLIVLEEAKKRLGNEFDVDTITNEQITQAIESGRYEHVIKLNRCIEDNPAYSLHQAAKIANDVVEPKLAPKLFVAEPSRRERRLQRKLSNKMKHR